MAKRIGLEEERMQTVEERKGKRVIGFAAILLAVVLMITAAIAGGISGSAATTLNTFDPDTWSVDFSYNGCFSGWNGTSYVSSKQLYWGACTEIGSAITSVTFTNDQRTNALYYMLPTSRNANAYFKFENAYVYTDPSTGESQYYDVVLYCWSPTTSSSTQDYGVVDASSATTYANSPFAVTTYEWARGNSGGYTNGAQLARVNIEMHVYYAGTTTEATVSGILYFSDLDDTEGWKIVSGAGSIYTDKNFASVMTVDSSGYVVGTDFDTGPNVYMLYTTSSSNPVVFGYTTTYRLSSGVVCNGYTINYNILGTVPSGVSAPSSKFISKYINTASVSSLLFPTLSAAGYSWEGWYTTSSWSSSTSTYSGTSSTQSNVVLYSKFTKLYGDLTVQKKVNTGNAVNANSDLSGYAFHLSGTSAAGDTVDLYAVTDTSGYAYFTDVPVSTDSGYLLEEVTYETVSDAADSGNSSAGSILSSVTKNVIAADSLTTLDETYVQISVGSSGVVSSSSTVTNENVFAVYSEKAGSLTFYNVSDSSKIPAVGDTYNGSVVTAVYTGFETATYSSPSSVPWYSVRTSIQRVTVATAFAPVSTRYWFYGFKACTSMTLTKLDTSNVTTMASMFVNCSSLKTLSLTGFDTSNVTTMASMFYGCSSLTSLTLTSFDTSSVTTMDSMFYGCSSLTTLNLYSFYTGNVKYMNHMFYNCTSLKYIYVSDYWSTASVTASTNMFYGCSALVGGSGTACDGSSNITATYACIDTDSTPGYLTNRVYVSLTVTNYIRAWNLTVTKMDSTLQEYATPYEGLSLEGAVYGLYDADGNLIEECTTDENGRFTTDYYVNCTEWYIQEISPSFGYELDDTKYYIDTTISGNTFYTYGDEDQYVEAELTNGATADGYENTVLETKETVSATVIKNWDDNSNELAARPSSLDVYLYRNSSNVTGEYVTAETLSGTDDSWAATITGLDKYDSSGAEYSYYWEEESIPSVTIKGEKITYTANSSTVHSGDTYTTTITNTTSSEILTTDITVVKQVDDSGTGQTDVSGWAFYLSGTSAQGADIRMYALSDADGNAVFPQVPYSDADGYTITEVSADDVHTAAENGNAYALAIDGSVTKDPADCVSVWSENTVVESTQALEFTATNTLKSWYITVTKMDSILQQFNTAQDGYTLDGAEYGLYNDGTLVETYTVKDGRFTTTTTDTATDVYYPCGDNWYIKEISAPTGYVLDETEYAIAASNTDISGAKEQAHFTDEYRNSADGYDDVVFEEPELVSAVITKTWANDDNVPAARPAEITATLYKESTRVSKTAVTTAALKSDNSWAAEVSGLVKYDPDGEEYSYYWEEGESSLTSAVVNGQQVTYALTESNTEYTGNTFTTTLTNTATVTMLYTTVTVEKTVDDSGTGNTDVSGFAFHLYGTSATGNEVDMYAVTDNSGKAEFTEVPYSDTDGYTVAEVSYSEVETAASDNDSAAAILGSVTKDLNDYISVWSDTIIVDTTAALTLSAENTLKSWYITVTKMDSILQTYAAAQDGYTLEGAEYGLYNGVDADPVAVFYTDANGQFSTNSESVYYPCGDGWYIQEISAPVGYTKNDTVYYIAASNTDISGTRVLTHFTDGCASSADGYEDVVFEDPELVSLTVTVTWDDHDDEMDVRPDTVTVYLYRDNGSGNPEPVTPSGVELIDGTWEYTIEDLPKYDPDGNEYTYYWTQEKLPDSYTIPDADGEYDIDGYSTESETEYDTDYGIFTTSITNTLEVMIPVAVTKVWDDENNAQKIRPDAVYAFLSSGAGWIDVEGNAVVSGTTTDTAVALSEDNSWYVRLILPKYDANGDEVSYAFTEILSALPIEAAASGTAYSMDSVIVNGDTVNLGTLDFSWCTGNVLTGYEAAYEYGVYGTGTVRTQTVITNSHTPNAAITLTETVSASDFTYYRDAYGENPSFTFELEDEGGNITTQVFEITPDYVAANTDPDGNVTISAVFTGLEYGTYTITKTIQAREWTNVDYDAENGTVKPAEVIEFTVDSSTVTNGLTLLATYEESYEPTAEITVTKRISVSSLEYFAEDAEFTFTLIAEDGTVYAAESKTITFAADMDESLADSEGYFSISATFANLPYGTAYTLAEASMPQLWTLASVAATANGEAVNDTEVRYEITKATAKDTYSAVFTDEYISGAITIIKYGSGHNLLDGVSYTLYNSDGDTVATGTTGDDGDGTVAFTGLVKGTYIITETSTVDGYTLLADEIIADIPMTLTDAEYEQYKAAGIVIDVTAAASYRNGVYTFTDLTYEISDTANLTLPTTGDAGKDRKVLLAIFAGLILTAAVAVGVSLKREHRQVVEGGLEDPESLPDDVPETEKKE